MLLDLVLETNSHLSTEQMVMYMEINPEKGKSKYTLCLSEKTACYPLYDTEPVHEKKAMWVPTRYNHRSRLEA